MSGIDDALTTVTLRVNRFAPRPERDRGSRGGSPFAKKGGSPFAGGSSRNRRPRGKQWTQDYTLRVRPEDTVLDCLLTVKRTIDPTLAFRYSCGHGMCGSDAVAINGTPTLLCTASVGDWAKRPNRLSQADDEGFRRTGDADEPATDVVTDVTGDEDGLGVIELSPLPGFPVQRDLIADIDPMLDQIRKLKPYLQADGVLATTHDGKVDVFEYLQNPQQLAKYEMLTNCIACGVCEGSCPVFAGGDAFIGPAALIAASRFVNDSRDTATAARLDAIDTADGVAACQSVRACSRQCPRGIDVGEEMWQIVAKVKER
ncbi:MULTISPECIES: succinate dehydrogenase/fumarate reductase iron-sulfur subunit [Bifidobacterium]|uniref:succinate dehydrogenase/fumarate reductase iron-sulfur subunit n=1 Tax=Bifidobacterium TaxID=1678 RepID=UPI001BDCC201|nr:MULTISPECIES: 2Fe-2S iron-sulfur cluster-binding protein [Bifidobacterium]MBT1161598.1 4Fe-4S dicluster domain-containing protein [Bifidobacterium sp. SO1]MBW3078788.1 4Fe-4S dicluster domain-containing protein [Bifidobacterium simiiventris]